MFNKEIVFTKNADKDEMKKIPISTRVFEWKEIYKEYQNRDTNKIQPLVEYD